MRQDLKGEHVSLDTNIFVYAIDSFSPRKQELAVALTEHAAAARCRVGLQVVGEFYRAATSKLKLPPSFAAERADDLLEAFQPFAHSAQALRVGLAAAARGRFSGWDGILLASAAEAGCLIMLSEDMHDGAKLGDIVVRNPFGPKGLSDAAQEALGL